MLILTDAQDDVTAIPRGWLTFRTLLSNHLAMSRGKPLLREKAHSDGVEICEDRLSKG
jgi:hypothetical protein